MLLLESLFYGKNLRSWFASSSESSVCAELDSKKVALLD